MTGLLITNPTFRAVDVNGVPMSGALLQWYLTGTTTPTPVYTSAALTTPLSNPVVSDSAGLFPAMFRDPTVTYRAQLYTSAMSLVQDLDPVAAPLAIANGSVTAAMLATAAATGNLGYTPVNKAGDTATNLLLNNTTVAWNSAGYLGAPRNTQNASYTFGLTDAGAGIVCDDGVGGYVWTLPLNASVAFPLGTVIVVRLRAGASITLTRTSGVALRIAGSLTSKDVSLSAWGYASLMKDESDDWVVAGTGLS